MENDKSCFYNFFRFFCCCYKSNNNFKYHIISTYDSDDEFGF